MYKHWFIKRLIKEITKKDGNDNPPPNKSMSADDRALMGMSRPEAPSRLKRFS